MKVCIHRRSLQLLSTMELAALLGLATLGKVMQIEMILSELRSPRWPRQVQSLVNVAANIALKFTDENTA
jgi:hypothetical protein